MKKKVIALCLAAAMAFSSFGMVYADNTEGDNDQEQVTEEVQEPETESEKEPETESKEEETTATEATTDSATTTTKPPSSSSNNRYTEESKEFNFTLSNGDTKSLYSYIEFTNLEVEDFDWQSTDDRTVDVTTRGVISAKRIGSATITARGVDGGTRYTFMFDITVKNSSTSSSSKSFTISVGNTRDLYKYVDDKYKARNYTWESSNNSIATVNSSGVVTAKKRGTTEITATYESSTDTLEYRFNITVSNSGSDDDSYSSSSSSSKTSSSSSSKNEVSVKTSWTIYVGLDDQVSVKNLLEDSPSSYKWTSDDEDIAEITESSATIYGNGKGSTRIYAKGDHNYTFTVKVDKDYSTEEIKVKGNDIVNLEDYLKEDIEEYNFSSDRKEVATVNSSGDVKGVANGVATIVCEHEDGDVVQVFVTVSGISSTKETTTESTTVNTTVADQAQTTPLSFTDVPSSYWGYTPIMNMSGKGYIKGIGNNKFDPEANCKRCDFTIVLTQIMQIDKTAVTSNYSDVKAEDYFYNYVGAAKAKNIDAGVSDDKFRPNDYITREEMMVMIYKGLVDIQGEVYNTDVSGLSKFTDADSVTPEYKEAVAALTNSNIVAGMSATELAPKANITRAQMAQLLNIFYNTINQ